MFIITHKISISHTVDITLKVEQLTGIKLPDINYCTYLQLLLPLLPTTSATSVLLPANPTHKW